MPYLIYGGVMLLLGAVGGGAATVAATDAADELGDAAEKTGNAVTKVMIVGGVLYTAYLFRGEIKKLVKG